MAFAVEGNAKNVSEPSEALIASLEAEVKERGKA
jgi:hypothetical protein